MYDIILSFITAYTLTYFAIPSIIHVSHVKRLMDEPGERRSHVVSTPSLGGIAIFAGVIFSIVMWTPFQLFGDLQYILCAFIIIFLIGAKDDIVAMSPRSKFLGEIFAALILIFKSNVRITSLEGILGIYELPEIWSVVLSLLTILLIINAFNLIDGINGLTGCISAVILTMFGLWFYKVGRIELSLLCFATMGTVFAFLKYNFTPAKIFMGDTGALFLGLISAILSLEFIRENQGLAADHFLHFKSGPAIAIAVMIIPIFDTLRVFTSRILKGKSPFYPDRTHIHHFAIDSGLSHLQATFMLTIVNILFIVMAFYLDHLGNLKLLLVIAAVAGVLTLLLSYMKKQKQQQLA